MLQAQSDRAISCSGVADSGAEEKRRLGSSVQSPLSVSHLELSIESIC